jgi:hypothetical protein
MKRKCYECGTTYNHPTCIFCDDCVDKPRTKGSSTLVIYDKV